MLNYLWSGMILLGIITSLFTGRLPEVTGAAIESSREAVALCITMLGILSMWTGLMKIAQNSGLIQALSKKMQPFLYFLFPELPKKCKAFQYIATNFIANILGLGWAATPAGLKAMEEMQALNPKKQVASKSMCMFMVVNMSSLQLITVSIIAYRAQYGSASPSEIIGPGLLATLVSTIAGITVVKVFERWYDD